MHTPIKIKNNKPSLNLAECASYLKGALDGIIAKGESYTLLGDYPQIPNLLTGNDIDLLVSNIEIAKLSFMNMGFVFRQQQKFELRAFLYIKSTSSWIAVDIETIDSYNNSGKEILKYILNNPVIDRNNGICNPPQAGIMAYKIFKYINNGYIHSRYQLNDLKEKWSNSSHSDRKVAISLIQSNILDKETMKFVMLFIESSGGEIFNYHSFSKFLDIKREERHKNRLVYQGKINTKELLKKPKLLFSLVRARLLGSNSMLPAVAIVGNDGSGKTEQCQRLKDELYKLDPLHIVMRGNEAWLPGWRDFRKSILSYTRKRKKSKNKLNRFFVFVLSWVGEIGDFLDKWFKYQVGMAWVNSGFGFVMFERYPTDRLRGEYPGPKWSLFPIEQYFPMPDVIVLLDVREEDSLKRKINDGHTYNEMHDKRVNYLNLIKEIEPSLVISANQTIDKVQRQLSRMIWDHSYNKQQIKTALYRYPAKWKPTNRDLCKSSNHNGQKDGFHE